MISSYQTWSTHLFWQFTGASCWSQLHTGIFPMISRAPRGDDENVPVWHTREAVSVLKTWDPQANVTYARLLSSVECVVNCTRQVS